MKYPANFTFPLPIMAVVVIVGSLGLRATSNEIAVTIQDRYMKIAC